MNNLNEYKNRFYTLMESTMGNVKPLITEEDENNTIDLTDLNSQVPDNLVDNADLTPDGTYTPVGGRGNPQDTNEFTLCYEGNCYRVPGKNVNFNWVPNGMRKPINGKITGTRNTFFYEPYVANGKSYDIKYYFGGQLATNVINKSDDKLIGFDTDNFSFYCYTPKSGGDYVCEEFTYEF
jgi:hypothetical protein